MKKIIFGLVGLVGAFMVCGAIGSLELEKMTLNEAVLKSMDGVLVILSAATGNMLWEIVSTIKRNKKRNKKEAPGNNNIIEIKFSA